MEPIADPVSPQSSIASVTLTVLHLFLQVFWERTVKLTSMPVIYPTIHVYQELSVWIYQMALNIPAVYPALKTFKWVKACLWDCPHLLFCIHIFTCPIQI